MFYGVGSAVERQSTGPAGSSERLGSAGRHCGDRRGLEVDANAMEPIRGWQTHQSGPPALKRERQATTGPNAPLCTTADKQDDKRARTRP